MYIYVYASCKYLNYTLFINFCYNQWNVLGHKCHRWTFYEILYLFRRGWFAERKYVYEYALIMYLIFNVPNKRV